MPLTALPKAGRNADSIKKDLQNFRQADANWRDGRTFSLVFNPGEEAVAIAKHAYCEYFSENALNPSAFPSLRKMEQDCVAMTANLLNGNKKTCGLMTSGGTESLLMAVKSARDWGRAKGITEPNIILPISAHPAFHKAADYFGVEMIVTPVTESGCADINAMRGSINTKTIMLVGSAPSYPHGVVDPIAGIAKLAKDKELLCHVDSCIGGFILPFIEALGRDVPSWDFRVDGVTSISCDLHKYAYAAKGASVLLYSDEKIRRHQYSVYTEWSGGIYASPSVSGTRSGGAIAAAWAVMNFLGYDGYLDITRRTMECVDKIRKAVGAMEDIRIIGDPQSSILALYSEKLCIFTIGDELQSRGWMADRQHMPNSLHLTISQGHAGREQEFIDDLQWALDRTRRAKMREYSQRMQVSASGKLAQWLPDGAISKIQNLFSGKNAPAVPKRSAAVYGMLASIPERGEIKELVKDALDKINSPA